MLWLDSVNRIGLGYYRSGEHAVFLIAQLTQRFRMFVRLQATDLMVL
ncbi:MAG: hypothetical protein WBA22_07100 [Candidatus Methanofastidiosia archaeon]